MTEELDQQLFDADGRYQADIAAISASLGFVLAVGLGLIYALAAYRQLGLYIAQLAVFHFLEFYITARYNSRRVSLDSFLFNNGNTYTYAHVFAVVESVVEYWFFPQLKRNHNILAAVGVVLTIVGQVLRSLAMVQAGSNFSHSIANVKTASHKLVTTGVYSWSRHPSYSGFFYWALGTQLALVNPVALASFTIVLWRFFHRRIIYEEARLVQFFGDDYVEFRKQTPTRIPFIN